MVSHQVPAQQPAQPHARTNPSGPNVGLLLLLLLAACAGPAPTSSPTPLPTVHLAVAAVPAGRARLQQWFTLYQQEHSGVRFELLPMTAARAEGALAQGQVDLALLDRPPASSYQGVITATSVAEEPIAVVVHPGNRLDDLSSVAITGLLSGQVPAWSQVGGGTLPVRIYLPPDSSGEVVAFAAQAMVGQHLSSGALIRSEAASVVRAVSQDPGGIGLAPAGETAAEVDVLRVDGVLPAEEGYPWRMPLFLAWGKHSPPAARFFLHFVLALAM